MPELADHKFGFPSVEHFLMFSICCEHVHFCTSICACANSYTTSYLPDTLNSAAAEESEVVCTAEVLHPSPTALLMPWVTDAAIPAVLQGKRRNWALAY